MSQRSTMSTDAMVPAERAAVWCDWVRAHVGGLGCDRYGHTHFDGHMSASRAGVVVLRPSAFREAGRSRATR